MYRNNLHYVYIKDILNRQKGIYITAQQMKELDSINGDIRVFAGGNTTANIERKRISLDSIIRKPSIIVKSRGNIDFEYYDRPFTHKNELWSYSISCDNVNLKYIYYIFKENKCLFVKKAKANSVKLPQLTVGDTDNYLIPLPSIKVQEEIVEILDSFTNLIDALNEELSLRQKQFEYYREKLLTFDESVKKIKLEEIGYFYGGLSGKSKKDFIGGNKKFISYMNIFTNSTVRLDIDDKVKVGKEEKQNKITYGDILFTGSSETPDECGMTSVVTCEVNEDIYLNSFSFGYRFNNLNGLFPKFFSFLMRSHFIRDEITKTANGVTRFNVSKKLLGKVMIPIPPLSIQKSIVEKLDAFESLISSLKEEIALRQKQYEYYREKLLTFD